MGSGGRGWGVPKHARGLDMFMSHGGALQHVLYCTAVTTPRLKYIYIAGRTVEEQGRRNCGGTE